MLSTFNLQQATTYFIKKIEQGNTPSMGSKLRHIVLLFLSGPSLQPKIQVCSLFVLLKLLIDFQKKDLCLCQFYESGKSVGVRDLIHLSATIFAEPGPRQSPQGEADIRKFLYRTTDYIQYQCAYVASETTHYCQVKANNISGRSEWPSLPAPTQSSSASLLSHSLTPPPLTLYLTHTTRFSTHHCALLRQRYLLVILRGRQKGKTC